VQGCRGEFTSAPPPPCSSHESCARLDGRRRFAGVGTSLPTVFSEPDCAPTGKLQRAALAEPPSVCATQVWLHTAPLGCEAQSGDDPSSSRGSTAARAKLCLAQHWRGAGGRGFSHPAFSRSLLAPPAGRRRSEDVFLLRCNSGASSAQPVALSRTRQGAAVKKRAPSGASTVSGCPLTRLRASGAIMLTRRRNKKKRSATARQRSGCGQALP